MTRTIMTNMKWALCAAVIAGSLTAAPARAQDIGDLPPEVIATTTPVFFEGRAAYWWNGRWYYRDGNYWRFYHDEPVFLRGWRDQHHEPERRFYEGRGYGNGRVEERGRVEDRGRRR